MDRERKDRFDRFLAYVFVDDRMLNEELIREGLASGPNRVQLLPADETADFARRKTRPGRRGAVCGVPLRLDRGFKPWLRTTASYHAGFLVPMNRKPASGPVKWRKPAARANLSA